MENIEEPTKSFKDKLLANISEGSKIVQDHANTLAFNIKTVMDEKGYTETLEHSYSTASKAISDNADYLKAKMDEHGITEKIDSATVYTKDKIDIITAQKHLNLVEERLTLQMRYNDILATKLDEALKRIEALEKNRG